MDFQLSDDQRAIAEMAGSLFGMGELFIWHGGKNWEDAGRGARGLGFGAFERGGDLRRDCAGVLRKWSGSHRICDGCVSGLSGSGHCGEK